MAAHSLQAKSNPAIKVSNCSQTLVVSDRMKATQNFFLQVTDIFGLFLIYDVFYMASKPVITRRQISEMFVKPQARRAVPVGRCPILLPNETVGIEIVDFF